MKKKKGRHGITGIIVLLAIILVAVIALIVWKRWEYRSSAAFYEGLRGALRRGGICA